MRDELTSTMMCVLIPLLSFLPPGSTSSCTTSSARLPSPLFRNSWISSACRWPKTKRRSSSPSYLLWTPCPSTRTAPRNSSCGESRPPSPRSSCPSSAGVGSRWRTWVLGYFSRRRTSLTWLSLSCCRLEKLASLKYRGCSRSRVVEPRLFDNAHYAMIIVEVSLYSWSPMYSLSFNAISLISWNVFYFKTCDTTNSKFRSGRLIKLILSAILSVSYFIIVIPSWWRNICSIYVPSRSSIKIETAFLLTDVL